MFGTILSVKSPIKFKILEEGSTVVHPAHVDELEGVDLLPDDVPGRAELIGRRVTFRPRTPSDKVESVTAIKVID